MANPERHGLVEGYKKLNKWSLTGALGVVAVGAVFAPALIAPALTWAAIDGGQIVLIDQYQKKRENNKAGK